MRAVHVNLARFPILANPYCLHIPRDLYKAMLAQAVVELPNECCGLLAGTVTEGIGRVTRRFPLVNAAEDPAIEYLSESRSLFAAHRAMRDLGVEMLAVYHSHPTSAPIPSRKDRDRNAGESVVHLIISPVAGRLDVRAWWLTETEATEADWKVVNTEITSQG